jgi:SAM-dependent methyltransferase
LDFCQERGCQLLVQASSESLPFQAESFDTVVALDLLEHLDDDVAGAREAFRILRPGGQFLSVVPAYRWLWGPQDDVSHHRRRYTPRSLSNVVRGAGFTIVRLTHMNLFLLPLILAGRRVLRLMGKRNQTENNLHPAWLNDVLRRIFTAERHVIRAMDLPLGVSLLCVATKNTAANSVDFRPVGA